MEQEVITRARLEEQYDDVIDTDQLREQYIVRSFCMGLVFVTRKSDGVKGSMNFTHMPRFYYDFQAD